MSIGNCPRQLCLPPAISDGSSFPHRSARLIYGWTGPHWTQAPSIHLGSAFLPTVINAHLPLSFDWKEKLQPSPSLMDKLQSHLHGLFQSIPIDGSKNVGEQGAVGTIQAFISIRYMQSGEWEMTSLNWIQFQEFNYSINLSIIFRNYSLGKNPATDQ